MRNTLQRPERRRVHLTRGHGELAVFADTSTYDAADLYVVGRVKKRHMGLLVSEKPSEVLRTACVTAQQPMFAELPKVARSRRGRTVQTVDIDVIEQILNSGVTPEASGL